MPDEPSHRVDGEKKSLALYKHQVKAAIRKIEAESSAKEVAGKAIGKYGLWFITLIVVIGVVASLYLEQDKMAAVMGLLGASLTALISLLASVANGQTKVAEKPEYAIMRELIDKLDVEHEDAPMTVDVDGDHVTVQRGNDTVRTKNKE
jgi:hypothetical protein